MKKSFKALILSVLTLMLMAVLPCIAEAQNYHTDSKRAVKFYKKAMEQFEKRDYSKTAKYIDKALYQDSKFADAWLLKAELSLKQKDEDMAIECYQRIYKADSMAFPRTAITLSELYTNKKRYADAVDILQWYVKLPGEKEKYVNQARELLELAEFRMSAVDNPVSYDAVNLGPSINTSGDEYINQILPDNSRIYLTRRGEFINKKTPRTENLYTSAIVNGEYMPAMQIPIDLNNNKRMGAVSITADQNKMYFVGIDFIDSQGRGDIYESDYVNGEWSKPVNLGNIVNTSQMESQPCISADGKELYFVRESNARKTSDLFYSESYQGKWTNPKPIKSAHSKGNEMSPFLHPDGNTLYFASDGLPGMGGFDIYMCKRLPEGDWSEPVNLGYPINSEKDEISFVVSTDGKKAFISTNRDGGLGGFDVYVFDLDEVDGPEPVDMTMFVMRNINFEFESAVLQESSFAEIDNLVSFMNDNPYINIEISGHTDNTGTTDHNMTLSLERANAVKNAIVEKGIQEKRISVKGFGELRPVVPNDSDDNKALNRRVEVRVF